MSDNKKSVVVIGGGSGQPVILKALKEKNVDITAVVTVADDGGSSGIIRDYMNIVPPGDIRNALSTLANTDPELNKLFQYRFNSDDDFFKNHALGNLIIAAMTEMHGSIFEAVQQLGNWMNADGHVYPVADEPLVLHAKFSDGTEVQGEHNVTYAHKKIERIWVTTENGDENPAPVKEVITAIQKADLIVLGPGSLYTSVLPNLVIPQVGKAIAETKAPVAYIANVMTQLGETDNYTDADHIKAINSHLPKDKSINYILSNTTVIPDDYIDFQEWDEISDPVVVDVEADLQTGATPITGDFVLLKDNGAFHDGDKIVDKLLEIL